MPYISDLRWESLAEITPRECFSRVWVIQEMEVGRKRSFLCGRLRIEPEDIETLALSLMSLAAIRNPLLLNLLQSVKGRILGFQRFFVSRIVIQRARTTGYRIDTLSDKVF